MPTYDPKDDPYAEIPVKDFSYTNNPKPDQPKGNKPRLKNNRWVLIGSAVVLIILIALAALFVFHNHKVKHAPNKTSTSSKTSVSVPSNGSSFGLTFNPSTMYSSPNYNLEVTYPKAWTVSDTTSSMTLTSPVTQLKNASGQNTDGKIVVSVLNQGKIPSAFGTSSVAVLNSSLISYTNPTQSQAQQTYLSFIQYPATTTKGGLDGIYITGNYGYKYAQTIPNTDINNLNPLVIVSFLSCSSSSCTSPTSLTISSIEWHNSGFSSLIENILKSFIFN